MKKGIKKLVCLILAGIATLSFAACKPDNQGSTGGTTGGIEQVNPNHDFTATETRDWILKNGHSDYTIVVPADDMSTSTSYARVELITLFKEATGVELPWTTDENLTHSSTGKYLSIGKTNLYKTSGLSVDFKVLRDDGVRIITKDKTVYFLGGETGNGNLNAIYDFLHMTLNFEAYYLDCYELDHDVRNIRLMNYNVTDIPDIPFRRQGTGVITNPITNEYNDRMFGYRMRANTSYADYLLQPHQRWGDISSAASVNHNSWICLPKDEYMEDYPEFYSQLGNQLCYTARGDKEKYEVMVETVFQKIVQSLKWYTPKTHPKKNAFMLGMEDNLDWCDCDACTEIIEYYGANSATILRFCNDLSDKVQAWMADPANAEYAREDFDIMFFAYSSALLAPFQYNEETQKYEARDEGIIPRKNVTIFLAVSGFDHGVGVDHELNVEVRDNIRAWATYMDKIFTWRYGGFINDYYAPVDVFNFDSDCYKLFEEINADLCFSQQHSSQRGADSSFFILAGYVGAKLMWDSSLDVNELINNYMNAMYKDAAPYMMQLFELERMWFNTTHEKMDWTHTFWWLKPTYDGRYWTIGYVNQAFALLDKAYKTIERYKTDPVLYENMKAYIDMEWLHPAKVAVSNFESSFSADEYNRMKSDFKTTCYRLGMNMAGETTSLEKYFNEW